MERLEGAFALAILFAGHHEMMIGARRGVRLPSVTETARCTSARMHWRWRR